MQLGNKWNETTPIAAGMMNRFPTAGKRRIFDLFDGSQNL